MDQHQQLDSNGGSSSSKASFLCRQSSTRWIPTSDQIRILRELYYNNGIRSPNADQIQKISARLRQYGKIEGKNVFYWFQNHKARERQKKRLTLDVTAAGNTNSTAPPPPAALSKAATSNLLSPVGLYTTVDHMDISCGRNYVNDQYSNVSAAAAAAVPWMYNNQHYYYLQPADEYDGGGAVNNTTAASASSRQIETLPLFPVHTTAAMQLDSNMNCYLPPAVSYYSSTCAGRQQQEEYYSSSSMNNNNGAEGAASAAASLELTLNSNYCSFAPPGSV